MMKKLIAGILLLSVVIGFSDERRQGGRRSLIDSEPDVIYVADLLPPEDQVELFINEPAQVYATRTGGRKLGVLTGGKVTLIGFDSRACKVQGQGKIGWISPTKLRAAKGNIQELLQTVYNRETEVKRLIEAGEVALGMSREEVCRVLGQPTKQTIRRTKDGINGTLEFTEFEEIDHFQPLIDPFSGVVFRRFTHSTQEEKSKVVVEFEDGVASAIEESEQENGGNIRVVVRPVLWIW